MFQLFKKKSRPESSTFCVMPWTNLTTETNGKCKICCIVMTNRYIKHEDGNDYLIQRDSIKTIWNSQYMRDVRKKMLNGEKVTDCTYCYQRESLGQSSPRQSYNERWLNSAVKNKVSKSRSTGIVDELPISLEPRPGILCNLKCISCWSLSSSKILNERKKALENLSGELPEHLKETWRHEIEWASESDFDWSESPQYLENVDQCLPKLERLYFTGGEPVLIRSNLETLRALIKRGRTDLLISFTTNLHQFPDEWIEVLSHFARVEITGSVDGFSEANDYIRFPSQWERVEANLRKLHHLYPQIHFSIIFVVQVLNVFSYLKLVRWVAQEFPRRQILVMPTMLQGPPYLMAQILTDELKEKAFLFMDEVLGDPRVCSHNKDYVKDVRHQLLQKENQAVQLRAQLKDYLGYLDRSRKTDVTKTFPELQSLVETPKNYESDLCSLEPSRL